STGSKIETGSRSVIGEAAAATPRPAMVTPALPSRQSLRGVAAVATPEPKSVRVAPAPASEPPSVRVASREPSSVRVTSREPSADKSRDETPAPAFAGPATAETWEDRLGPIGIAISALVVCALAWLLTWGAF